MHWVLQENLFKEHEWDNLVGTLERFNIPYSVHKVIPFIGEAVPPVQPRDKKVICFGSYSMRHMAKKNDWAPGVYDLEPFDFRQQLARWGNRMLNSDAMVMPFKDVKFEDIAHLFPDQDSCVFIRPIHDSKVFSGGIFDWKDFNEWQHKVCVLDEDFGDSLTGDTLVQVCAPKKIYAEYRFWIIDGRITTYSLYKRGTRVIYDSNVDAHVIRYAEECIRTDANGTDITLTTGNPVKQPADAYVLDVCETPDGMKIVEVNTINAAGFYAGRIQDVVLALEALNK